MGINKHNSKKVKRIPLLFALIITVSGILSIFANSPTFAATDSFTTKYKNMDPADQSLSMQYAFTLSYCFTYDNVTAIKMGSDGKTINTPPAYWFNFPYGNAAFINGASNIDGKATNASCVGLLNTNFAKNAFKLWGWDGNYASFITKVLKCTANTSKGEYECPNGSQMKDNFISKLMLDVYEKSKPDQSIFYNIKLSEATEYKYWYDTFTLSCSAKTLPAVTDLTGYEPESVTLSTKQVSVPGMINGKIGLKTAPDAPIIGVVKTTIVIPDIANTTNKKTALTYEDWYVKGSPSLRLYTSTNARFYAPRNLFGYVTPNTAGSQGSISVEKIPADGSTVDSRLSGMPQNLGLNCHEILEKLDSNGPLFKAFINYLKTGKPNPIKIPPVIAPNTPGKVWVPPTVVTPTPDPTPETTTTQCAITGIGWIVCPVLNFMAGVADGAFGVVKSFLVTSPNLTNTDPNNGIGTGTYNAWQAIRNIANIVFVIVFLIIIFSQLSSIGVTNYGIKKMLPKLIIAAILVNLSFFICQVAIDLSNIIGYSIQNLIEGITPASTSTTSLGDTATGWGGIVSAVITSSVAVIIIISTAGTLIPVLLAVIVAIVMILFILIARQALIVILIMLAPLAFVAFLLPNTEKLFTQWRKALTAMLILFPVVAFVFAGSKMASTILTDVFQSNGSDNWWGQIAAAALATLPLFVVPGLLKKSLDGVGKFGEKIGSLASGASGAARKKYEGSQFGKFRQGEIDKENALIRSGAYTGKNPFKKVNSRGHKAINENEYFNRKTGGYGNKQSVTGIALADEMEAKELKDTETLLRSRVSSPSALVSETQETLQKALVSGDEMKARAATKILLGSGGAGIEAAHNAISSAETTGITLKNTSTFDSVKGDIGGAGIKDKDAALHAWATKSVTSITKIDSNGIPIPSDTLSVRTDNKESYAGLSNAQIAGQGETTLKAAITSGAVSKETAAEIVKNDTLFGSMGAKEKEIIREHAQGAINPSNTQTTPQIIIEGTSPRTPGITEARDGYDITDRRSR